MPELPEVETVRRMLNNQVVGKKITGISVHYDKIITGEVKTFTESLTGQTLREIDRVGKYLIFILADVAFISHLRMEGKYHIVAADEPLNKHEHMVFHLSDGRELRYQDSRKFGRFQLAGKADYRRQPPLDKLGPEPWDAVPAEIYAKIHKSRLPVKTLLLDQHILAGIGNIYANEICFSLKMNPRTPGNRVSRKRTEELIQTAAEILEQAIGMGGTTVHSFDANGITGSFQERLQVHMREICPRCGQKIIKEAVHGRGTYYCGSCQV